jgi:hypothetical protein
VIEKNESPVPPLNSQSESIRPASGPSTSDKVFSGISIFAKFMVSMIWLALTILGFAAGVPLLGIFGIAYLVYLWIFRGRWLIY